MARTTDPIARDLARGHLHAVSRTMQPTPGATVHDLREGSTCGQSLAGSGALVFEGEIIDQRRLRMH